jgi:hypothetical protein
MPPLACLLRAGLCALGLAAGSAAPARSDCRLALALAVDISRSIDSQDYKIQTEGLALALEDPEVRRAIFAPEGEVTLAIYYWSGRGYQDLVQPWVRLDSPKALDTVIWTVRRTPRPLARLATALNSARPESVEHFFRLAAQKVRQVLLDLVERKSRDHDTLRSADGSAPGGVGGRTLDPSRLAEWTEFHSRAAALPDDERAVFELHYYLGLPQSEVAAALLDGLLLSEPLGARQALCGAIVITGVSLSRPGVRSARGG